MQNRPTQRLFPAIITGAIALLTTAFQSFATHELSGDMMQWHPITLEIEGPETSENAANNPFLNYRLQATFSNGEQTFTVPGYFAADGNSSETGADSGNAWRIHFVPNSIGMWKYEISFLSGSNIAVDDEAKGDPVNGNGEKGSFKINKSDKPNSDFRKKGRLLHGDSHYLQFAGNKEFFVKGGAGSPENFLAYADFDGTYSLKKVHRDGESFSFKLKTYDDHAEDWTENDPTWKDGKGKNIIGAINYLAGKGLNSIYFLTMNVYGDGQDVWPWVGPNEYTRFDCSKLDQWKIVFQHMERKGILAHIITQETENELLLDLGNTGTVRKLYYRELVARFSHQLAIVWNLGEENGYEHWTPNAQNTKQRKAMSAYLKRIDPYQNPVVLHTHAAMKPRAKILTEVLDDPNLDGPSFQINPPSDVHGETVKWRAISREAGKKWILPLDEVGPAKAGAIPDQDDPDHDMIRAQVLWGNLMGGGTGVEWYFGYKYADNDLNAETWKSRSILWDQTAVAINFFREHLPFEEMEPSDALTEADDDFVFAKENEVYCIYLPIYKPATIDLTNAKGSYDVSWFNPKTGGELIKGSVERVEAGSVVDLGIPIAQQNIDWVILLKKR